MGVSPRNMEHRMHDPANLLTSTTAIIVAALDSGRAQAVDVPKLVDDIYRALAGTASDAPATTIEGTLEFVPAVSARKSLASKDHILSMIDGKPYKTLRRHISGHGLTPEEYRARYNLPATYPMVAESYSEARRAMAKKIGLGRKPDNSTTSNTHRG